LPQHTITGYNPRAKYTNLLSISKHLLTQIYGFLHAEKEKTYNAFTRKAGAFFSAFTYIYKETKNKSTSNKYIFAPCISNPSGRRFLQMSVSQGFFWIYYLQNICILWRLERKNFRISLSYGTSKRKFYGSFYHAVRKKENSMEVFIMRCAKKKILWKFLSHGAQKRKFYRSFCYTVRRKEKSIGYFCSAALRKENAIGRLCFRAYEKEESPDAFVLRCLEKEESPNVFIFCNHIIKEIKTYNQYINKNT
jgi:hypothetical protein